MKKKNLIIILSILIETACAQTLIFEKDAQNKPVLSTRTKGLSAIKGNEAITIDCSKLNNVSFKSLSYDGNKISSENFPVFTSGMTTIPAQPQRKTVVFDLHSDEGDIKGFSLPRKKDAEKSPSSELSKAEEYFQNNFPSIFRNSFHYNRKANKAYLFLNEFGEAIGSIPVNIDQDDKIYVYLACPVSEIDQYKIEAEGGDYNPDDLSIRPFTPVVIPNAEGTGDPNEKYKNIEPKEFGPYTSSTVVISISKKSAENTYSQINSFTFRINKLYHVAVGVSLINTNLSSPDFKVVALTSTTNTIDAVNTGNRSLVTFNAIWYWSLLQNPLNGSIITQGRDILKDEPTFTLKRLFPTIGVSLDSKYKENFFVGGVYEFARGGSFIAGWHYGKIKELENTDFELGKTVFNGSQNDIITNDKWKWAFFFGVNLDTRILNLLFNRGKSNNQ